MKIALIGLNNLEYMPYLNKYLEVITSLNVEYDVIFWDRTGTASSTDLPGNYLYLTLPSRMEKSKVSKITDFYHYRKYVLKLLKENRYDKVIVLTSLTGVMLFTYLKGVPMNYVFDIRDYSYDRLPIFKNIMARLVCNSYFTAISSPGFLKWLPESDRYKISHNFNNKEMALANDSTAKVDLFNNDKIRISFVGLMRYFDENVRLIEQLKNNDRYELYFIGDGIVGQWLKDYCINNDINNVCFKGKYYPPEKPQFYTDTHFINCLYGSDSYEVTTATANRVYDSAIYRKPLIVSKGTYMEELVNKHSLGISVDLKTENINSAIEDYIKSFDSVLFNDNCQEFLELVKRDEMLFIEKLSEFLKS